MTCISLDTSVNWLQHLERFVNVLKKVSNGKPTRVDLVFDNCVSPSIKDADRNHRNADRNSKFKIVESTEVRPSDMNTAFNLIALRSP